MTTRNWHGANASIGLWIAAAVGCALLMSIPNPQLGYVALVAAGICWLTAAQPLWGLAGLVLTIPVQTWGAAELGGIELTYTKVAIVGVVGGWFLLRCRNAGAIRLDALAFILLSYLITLVLSITNAVSIGSWGAESYRWMVAFLLFVIACDILRTEVSGRPLLVAVSVTLAGSTILAMYQFATDAGPNSFQVNGVTRVFGTFGAPNSFAVFLEMSTLFAGAFLVERLSRQSWREMAWRWADTGLLLCCMGGAISLFLTQSRGGLLGFAAGSIALLALSRGPLRRAGFIAIVAASTIVLLFSGGAAVTERLLAIGGSSSGVQVTPDNWAIQERVAHWGAAVRMWRAEPWLGIGAGNFNERFREFTPEWRFRIGRGHAHNAYLQAASQAGTVGFVTYGALLLAILAATLSQARKRLPGDRRAAAMGAFAVSGALAVHGMFEYPHVLSLGLLTAVMWASGCDSLQRTDETS